MTATEYLNQVALIDTKIKCRERLLEEARELAYIGGGGIDYSAIRVDHSASNNQMDKIIDIVDSEREIRNELRKLHTLKHQVLERIERICDPKYSRLLWLHYVELDSLEQISRKMEYSYDWVRHMHKEALETFAELNSDIINTTHKNTDNT